MSHSFVNVSGAEFRGVAAQDGARIHARLTGSADVAALDAVGTLLARVHSEATRSGSAEAVIDLRDLEFMSSSCFKRFVTWISNIQTLERRYKVVFLSNPAMHWQKRSLHALRSFADDLVTVEAA